MSDNNKWQVIIDSKPSDVKSVEISHPNFGTLSFGEDNTPYPSWNFKENGGGGVIIILYFIKDNKIYVSTILEKRYTMGEGEHFCGIGGYVYAGENKDFAIERVLLQKTGIDNVEIKKFQNLPVNCNRSYIMADYKKDEGLWCYYAEMFADDFEKNGEFFTSKDRTVKDNLLFIPLKEILKYSADSFNHILVAQLLVELNS